MNSFMYHLRTRASNYEIIHGKKKTIYNYMLPIAEYLEYLKKSEKDNNDFFNGEQNYGYFIRTK